MILAPAGRRQIGFPTPERTTLAAEPALDGPHVRDAAPAAHASLSDGRLEDQLPVFASLWVRSGLPGVRLLEVRAPTARLGRNPANDLVLAGEGVDAEHAELRLRGGVWTVADLGSEGGTLVDGNAAVGEVPIAPGSTLQLGEVSLAFSSSDRWEDSPVTDRRIANPTLFVLPERRRSLWSRLIFLAIAIGAIAFTLWYLLGNP